MKVTLKRTGGVGGLTRHWTIDSDTLSPVKAEELKTLLKGTDFSSIKSVSPGQCRDHFCYEITIEKQEKKKTVQCSEENLTAPLRHCIDWITKAGSL